MKNEYQKMYDQIKTPEDWKNDIKAKMKQAMAEEAANNKETTIIDFKEEKAKRSKSVKWIIPVAGVAVAAVIFVAVIGINKNDFNRGKQDSSVGVTVATKYPDVNFVARGESLSVGTQLGNHGTVDDGQDKMSLTTTYSLDEGKKIIVSQYENGKMPQIDENEMSYIEGCPVAIIETTREGKVIYTASFEKKESIIKVEGENLEKLEFLDAVAEEIKR